MFIPSDKADDRDHTLVFNSVDSLPEGIGAANFDDVIESGIVGSYRTGCFAPLRVGFVVDNVVGSELAELLGFLVGRCGSYDVRTGGFGELDMYVQYVFIHA